MQNFLDVENQKNTIAHDDFKANQRQVKLQNFKANYDANSNAFQRLIENDENLIVIDLLGDIESMLELFTKNQKKEQKTNV